VLRGRKWLLAWSTSMATIEPISPRPPERVCGDLVGTLGAAVLAAATLHELLQVGTGYSHQSSDLAPAQHAIVHPALDGFLADAHDLGRRPSRQVERFRA